VNIAGVIGLEYFAGFFDGEGNIAIDRYFSPRSKSPIYNLLVGVSNTTTVPNLFRDRFGGSVRVVSRNNIHHSPIYDWRISGRKALEFLNLVLPYLQVKNKEVDIAVKFMNLPRSSKNTPTTFLTELRESYLQEIKALHTSGKGRPRKR